jgi:hypothetical protein
MGVRLMLRRSGDGVFAVRAACAADAACAGDDPRRIEAEEMANSYFQAWQQGLFACKGRR